VCGEALYTAHLLLFFSGQSHSTEQNGKRAKKKFCNDEKEEKKMKITTHESQK
jgi:hypothetical protein